jgi:hypothetical protein
LTELVSERDGAIAERSAVLAEKRSAYVEKDIALLQRDMAHADRNLVCMEHDRALSAISSSNGSANAKLMEIVNFAMNRPSMGSSFLSLPNHCSQIGHSINADSNSINNTFIEATPQHKKVGKASTTKKRKGSEVTDLQNGSLKSPTKHRKPSSVQQEGTRVKTAKSDASQRTVPCVAPYDWSSISTPFCSCTGQNRQCYRWGSGGWQSACCTNVLSVYPLPMNEAKRLAGRKMSGGAFKKLLGRLQTIGVDTTKPIDLKDHWAKHGTNRYVTIK